eukprot:857902-Lingulodinium_polyedra.AAC.1
MVSHPDIPAMPICDGPQIHREKGGPLPFFDTWGAADDVASSKPKKPVKAVCAMGFPHACVAGP